MAGQPVAVATNESESKSETDKHRGAPPTGGGKMEGEEKNDGGGGACAVTPARHWGQRRQRSKERLCCHGSVRQ